MNKTSFLYTRFPSYFFECIKYLVDNYSVEALVSEYNVDANSPYHINSVKKITIIKKSDLTDEVIRAFRPDLIYVSGWGDKHYKRITSNYKGKIPTVLGLDNPWIGNLKQYLATLLAPFMIKNLWSHVWIAGEPQYEYAKKLGYRDSNIIRHLYCANVNKFKSGSGIEKQKIVLFVGRLVDYKRPDWLLKAFKEIKEEEKSYDGWKLCVVGNGPMKENLQSEYNNKNSIEFKTFTQPDQLPEIYQQARVFCLPSNHEHWGVVVHEASAAGLVMLLSNTCGAATMFLENKKNGLIFNTDKYDDFKAKLKYLMGLDDHLMTQYSLHSITMSEKITHNKWCEQLLSIIEK